MSKGVKMIKFISAQGDKEIESKIEPFKFPGGEWHLKLPDTNETPLYAFVSFDPKNSELTTELIVLGLWVDWCHSLNSKAIILMPYLPAARADRGTPFGGKIYANIINSLNADEIRIFDPHSEIVPKLINNLTIITPTHTITKNIIKKNNITGIICPDKGAHNRAYDVASKNNLPIFTGNKMREFETGKILDYTIDLSNAPKDGMLLVVDDVCDGGGTFTYLAEQARLPKERLALWVSHGIFSGNAQQLNNYYEKIYTSNSLIPLNNINQTIFDILPDMLNSNNN